MNTEHIYQILLAKEKRAEKQAKLLENGGVLICYTLNIPGPVKLSELYRLLFAAGKKRIENELAAAGDVIVYESSDETYAGYEYYVLLKGGAAAAPAVKSRMCGIENGSAEGRLFDIDVLFRNTEGSVEKVSRKALGEQERPCLICGSPAFQCLRSARHTVPEVLKKTVDIILDSREIRKMILTEEGTGILSERISDDRLIFAEETAIKALKSLFYEVMTTPKPGLVDSENNGSHKDMDISLFFDSAMAIAPYLRGSVIRGMKLCERIPESILCKLRPAGIEAEKKMYSATGGVNTHKGAVFSFGVVCTAAGILYEKNREAVSDPDRVLELSGRICSSMKNGSEGIRKEAVNGYPSVRRACAALTEHRRTAGKKEDFNTEGLRLLCFLMSQTLDSNIVRRAGRERAEQVRNEAAAAGAFLSSAEELRKRLSELDSRYIEENISPGGAADLLALSYFFSDAKI